ncbi:MULTISPECIES: branched-chain amino acid ABC transporter permease [unclassified Phaeobacter]|uniref:branched-chain amino acid ABC transporter permease n=1 Tax=unclassified Phaeobacter TaxID=2621772 RepID=UPI003A8C19D1
MTRAILALLLTALAAAPFALNAGGLALLTEMLVLLAIAQSWNLLAGYGGLLSLGHHAFVATGAYLLFAVTRDLPVSPYIMVPLSGAGAALLALALTPVLFRLREVYFAIGMWVAAEIIKIVVSRLDYFGGSSGLPLYAARRIDTSWLPASAHWFALTLAAGLCLGLWLLQQSPYGLHVHAMRDDETAARSLGVKTRRIKGTIFVLSAAGCGMAGAISFLGTLYVSPVAAFDINWTVNAIFICVIGGLGTIRGPVLGVLLFVVLREGLVDYPGWSQIALGTIAVAVMLTVPKGLSGLLDRLLPRARTAARDP